MMAAMRKATFDVPGTARATLADGRTYSTNFPLAMFKWLKGKDWTEVVVRDSRLDQVLGWDRF